MPSASADNVGGHRLKYDNLKAHYPPEVVNKYYVGGSDPLWTGYTELELIRHFRQVENADIVDIGCGIGRLTRHLVKEPIKSYLGIDIIPEIMEEAINLVDSDDRFKFMIGQNCKIPMADSSNDIVAAFSVITHLLDEEAFEYIAEARRVLRPGGVAVFSFLDFMSPNHRPHFFIHAAGHRGGHGDLLKFTTSEILQIFSNQAGFSEAQFIDGATEIPTSGLPSVVLAGEVLPLVVTMGQSVCAMRV